MSRGPVFGVAPSEAFREVWGKLLMSDKSHSVK